VIKSKVMIWERNVTRIGETRITYKTSVGNPECNKTTMNNIMWEDNTKTNHKEMECENVTRIQEFHFMS
jgi:hypothetical protein